MEGRRSRKATRKASVQEGGGAAPGTGCELKEIEALEGGWEVARAQIVLDRARGCDRGSTAGEIRGSNRGGTSIPHISISIEIMNENTASKGYDKGYDRQVGLRCSSAVQVRPQCVNCTTHWEVAEV